VMKSRRMAVLAMVLALTAVCAVAVPFTLAFVMDRTPSLRNLFVPDPSVIESGVEIHISKSVVNLGSNHTGPDGFVFLLCDEATGETAASASTDENGAAVLQLSFDMHDAGKQYSYVVREQDGGIPGMTYSTDVHRVEVRIGTDDKFTPSVRLDGQAVETINLHFVNYYDMDHPAGAGAPPPTGDTEPIALYAVLMAVSACLAAQVLRPKKKA